tara:strand:+ start:5924 stop:8656 length:2733 start_codon:yes stop_codon:yes gene_type:complete
MINPQKAFIVSHTHWDREWYRTYHDFKVDLSNVVGEVLDLLEGANDFNHFVLDGQTIILRDYLSLFPEDAPRIKKLVQKGKLSLGPWYILPDEFLISSESTIRNLLLGFATAEDFGGVQRVGYMPDSFGHVAQVPQILKNIGIDSFIYTRGSGPEIEDLGFEYFWEAPDGSKVLAVNQCNGYCNAAGLGLHEIWHAHTNRDVDLELASKQVKDLFSKMSKLSNSPVFLLNNGCDHFPPQKDFDEILKKIKLDFPETRFEHSGFDAFVKELYRHSGSFKTHRGELLSGYHHFILSGVWSARIYLKQMNDNAQTWLSGILEPLASYYHFSLSKTYPSQHIFNAWKKLLENHPHDSICGCSTDEVHSEMIPRFRAVTETSESVLQKIMSEITPTFAREEKNDDQTCFTVFNALPEKRECVINRLIVLQPFEGRIEDWVLVDSNGEKIPFSITETSYFERFWAIDYRRESDNVKNIKRLRLYQDKFKHRIASNSKQKNEFDTFFNIQFVDTLPAVGHKLYFLQKGKNKECVKQKLQTGANFLENDFLKVSVNPNGTINILNKDTNHNHENLNILESSGDKGDEYDYSLCGDGQTVTSRKASASIGIIESTPYKGSLRVNFDLNVPKSIDEARQQRVDETKKCDIEIEMSLEHLEPYVRIKTKFNNQSEDHRLRAGFPMPESNSIFSDGHFYTNKRNVELPPDENWAQPHTKTYPQQDFSFCHDGSNGLAVFSKGLHEVEVRKGTLWLTLLRAVGWLSRDDFESRRNNNAGPTIYTPEAQCKGENIYEYALYPFSGDWIEARVKHWATRYKTDLKSMQGVADGAISDNWLLEKENDTVAITAIKKHESRNTLVVRMFNLSGEDAVETISTARQVKACWKLNLIENRQSKIKNQTNGFQVGLGAYEIGTFEVEFES